MTNQSSKAIADFLKANLSEVTRSDLRAAAGSVGLTAYDVSVVWSIQPHTADRALATTSPESLAKLWNAAVEDGETI